MSRPLLCLLLFLAGCGAAPVTAAPERFQPRDVEAFAPEVIDLINEARTRPQRFAERLRILRDQFEGDRAIRPGLPVLVTQEGPAAVDEAIAVMERQRPLPPLDRDLALDRAANDHARDQSRSGETSHYGADGSAPHVRMIRYKPWRRTAETIAYGGDTPEAVVLQLIVDDGVPDRSHRSVILDPSYTHIGAVCQPHPRFRTVCVADFGALQ
jgi:hypothetical protein